MSEWDDHHVAGCIWKAVQDDVAVLAAVDDLGLGIREFRKLAENAAVADFVLGCFGDVRVAPRSPEIVHKLSGDRMIGSSGDLRPAPIMLSDSISADCRSSSHRKVPHSPAFGE